MSEVNAGGWWRVRSMDAVPSSSGWAPGTYFDLITDKHPPSDVSSSPHAQNMQMSNVSSTTSSVAQLKFANSALQSVDQTPHPADSHSHAARSHESRKSDSTLFESCSAVRRKLPNRMSIRGPRPSEDPNRRAAVSSRPNFDRAVSSPSSTTRAVSSPPITDKVVSSPSSTSKAVSSPSSTTRRAVSSPPTFVIRESSSSHSQFWKRFQQRNYGSNENNDEPAEPSENDSKSKSKLSDSEVSSAGTPNNVNSSYESNEQKSVATKSPQSKSQSYVNVGTPKANKCNPTVSAQEPKLFRSTSSHSQVWQRMGRTSYGGQRDPEMSYRFGEPTRGYSLANKRNVVKAASANNLSASQVSTPHEDGLASVAHAPAARVSDTQLVKQRHRQHQQPQLTRSNSCGTEEAVQERHSNSEPVLSYGADKRVSDPTQPSLSYNPGIKKGYRKNRAGGRAKVVHPQFKSYEPEEKHQPSGDDAQWRHAKFNMRPRHSEIPARRGGAIPPPMSRHKSAPHTPVISPSTFDTEETPPCEMNRSPQIASSRTGATGDASSPPSELEFNREQRQSASANSPTRPAAPRRARVRPPRARVRAQKAQYTFFDMLDMSASVASGESDGEGDLKRFSTFEREHAKAAVRNFLTRVNTHESEEKIAVGQNEKRFSQFIAESTSDNPHDERRSSRASSTYTSDSTTSSAPSTDAANLTTGARVFDVCQREQERTRAYGTDATDLSATSAVGEAVGPPPPPPPPTVRC